MTSANVEHLLLPRQSRGNSQLIRTAVANLDIRRHEITTALDLLFQSF